jgi:hypothetical protein
MRKLRWISLSIALLMVDVSSILAQGTMVALPAPTPGATPPMFPDSPTTRDANRPSNGFSPVVLEPIEDPEHGTIWVDYLRIWYPRMSFARPTLTTGSAQDAFPGALGNASTKTLFGAGYVQPSTGEGFSIGGTIWVIQPCLSLSADYWNTGTGIFQRTFGSADGSKVISRPFFNPASGQEESLPISLPGFFSGTSSEAVRSRMQGADALLRWTLDAGDRGPLADGFYLTVVGGAKWIQLDESYGNQDNVTDLFFGAKSAFSDNFSTRNDIYAAVGGLEITYVWEKIKADLSAKFGVGTNRETAVVSGTTVFLDPTTNTQFVDPRLGTFAQPTNVGTYNRTATVYLGDFGFNVSYDCTRCVRVKLGYDFMWIQNVIRPSSQIDFRVNPQPLLGPVILPPALPAPPTLQQENIPVHTINFGLEIVF